MKLPIFRSRRLARARHAQSVDLAPDVHSLELLRARESRLTGGLVVKRGCRGGHALNAHDAAPGHRKYQYPFHCSVLPCVVEDLRPYLAEHWAYLRGTARPSRDAA